MSSKATIERTLSEAIIGLRAGIIVGPGMIVIIALGLAIAGSFLFPFVGETAWDPLLEFVESDLVGRLGAILYGLVGLLLILQALKFQYNKKGRACSAEDFLFGKASELWTQAPKRRASESCIPAQNHRPIVLSTCRDPGIELSLISSTGVTSVSRGLQ